VNSPPQVPGRFRCPVCGGRVTPPVYGESFAACGHCGNTLPLRDGIIALDPPASDRDYPHELVDLVSGVEDRHFWFAARRDVILSALRHITGGIARKRALDVGCGNGFMMAALEEAGLTMSGIDMHWSALVRARTRVRGPLFCSTATTLPFVPDFHLVTLLDVIEHVDDDVSVLDEARRVLAPHGHAIVTVPAGPGLWSTYDELIGHKRRYDRPALVAALRRAKFDVRQVSYFNCPLILAAAARRWTGRAQDASSVGGADVVRRALRVPPAPLNALLRWGIRAEAPLRQLSWIRGGSLIAVAQRLD
jgi:SAM-dependent methyltransferase